MCQLVPVAKSDGSGMYTLAEMEAMYERTIDEFVEKGQAFTGYEATIRTRSREGIKLRHFEQAAGIHDLRKLKDLVQFDDWNVGQVPTPMGAAICYYKDGYDLNNYVPMQTSQPIAAAQTTPGGSISQVPVSSQPAAPVGSPLGSDDDSDDIGGLQADGSYKADYLKRLLVPASSFESLQIVGGDQVQVAYEPNGKQVIVSKRNDFDHNYKVTPKTLPKRSDRTHHFLRIAVSTLAEAGITSDRYKIETVNSDIVITDFPKS